MQVSSTKWGGQPGVLHLWGLDAPAAPTRNTAPMFEQAFKNIDDILHKDAGCTSELASTRAGIDQSMSIVLQPTKAFRMLFA